MIWLENYIKSANNFYDCIYVRGKNQKISDIIYYIWKNHLQGYTIM